MTNDVEILERYYKSFINLESQKDFLIGLKDYLNFIETTPDFKKILDELLAQPKPLEDEIKKLSVSALAELSRIHKELLDYIQKNKINNEVINQQLREYDAWYRNEVRSSKSMPFEIHDLLSTIVEFLYQMPEHKEFASKYIEFSKDKTYIRHYLSVPECSKFDELERDIAEKAKTELWGQVLYILQLFKILARRDELKKKFESDKSADIQNDVVATAVVFHEWSNIQEGKLSGSLAFFDIAKIRPTIIRLENYLLRGFSEKAKQKIKSTAIKNALRKAKFGYYTEYGDIERIADKIISERLEKMRQMPHKIEIVGGKIEVDGLEKGFETIATKNEETTITKNKKVIRLPNFQSTPYKDATVRFLDERNVLISTPKKNVTADYEGLGFSDDKSKKPNLVWKWLFDIAKNGGESAEYQSPIPDTIKQKKLKISNFLQKIFKNSLDPFEVAETGLRKVKYRIKITLIPPITTEKKDHLASDIKEYLEDTMTSKYEPPKDGWTTL